MDLHLRRDNLARELGEEVTCDALTADFVMFQRRRGHRHSTDDLLTAWYAVDLLRRLPAPRPEHVRLLDLGSGIGSIGLAVLWCARKEAASGASLTAIEAQELSFRLLRENIEANGVAKETDAILGDLRDEALLEGRAFDLVTGSPPYFEVKAGIVSADSQRAHARFELRGDVRDYARAAARHLAPKGRFALCFPTVQRSRAEDACAAAGLALLETRDVVPKEGAPPLFSLFACGRGEDGGELVRGEPFVVRDASGVHTEALKEVQRCFGLGSRG